MLATANTGKTRERFRENTGEWTGRVEISKEEIPGSRRSMHGDIRDLLQALKGEPFSSGFSTDGSLISASAVTHCRTPETTRCSTSESNNSSPGLSADNLRITM